MPLYSSRQIIADTGTLTTADVNAGLLNPEQRRKFMVMVQDATVLGGLVSHEIHEAKSGEIDKIGVNRRLLRRKVENTDPGVRHKPNFGKVEYATTACILPFEVTENFYRENIEKENGEDIIVGLFAKQLAIDKDDLGINGDTSLSDDADDAEFLKLNDGWAKQIAAGGHILDGRNVTTLNSDLFFNARKLFPNKYNSENVRWMMSPFIEQSWVQKLNAICEAGGHVSESAFKAPAGIPILSIPQWADNNIGLSDPKNLADVFTYALKLRKTTEGEEAIYRDVRFYAMHFDVDFIIYETDATGMITNLAIA